MLLSLWLPILLSTIAVFFGSFVMWMVMPHHKKDWKQLPDEDALMATLRSQDMGAGQFGFPFCGDKSQMKDPDWIKKFEDGPSRPLKNSEWSHSERLGAPRKARRRRRSGGHRRGAATPWAPRAARTLWAHGGCGLRPHDELSTIPQHRLHPVVRPELRKTHARDRPEFFNGLLG